jgi:16S rRNA (guanine966-N2)-methyltransferase
MRIVAGTLKGRRINPPKKLPVRPTTDRAKEALFNILVHQYHFERCNVLDLYSGTGSISYEFGSRGVASIIAVDQHQGCIRFISQTATALSLPITAVKMPVFLFLERNSNSFDFIFADPPYALGLATYKTMINSIFEKKALSDEGLLIVEHHEQIDLSNNAHFSHARSYGGCVFSFFTC